ncbi:MAG: L,D-transpeptidase [Candidatus Sulfotelmatobacter sp.]
MNRPDRSGSVARKRAQRLLLAALAVAAATASFTQTAPAQTASTQTAKVGRDLAKRVVLVSVPDRKLAVLEDGTVLAQFPIAVGAAASPSPTGEFQIINRVSNPTYYRPGTVIPTGKDNPVGTRWLGLSQKGYGIHGTNAPRSIGQAASHGCIRLRNRDMERLFTMLRVGDVVKIRGERVTRRRSSSAAA